MYQWQRLGLSKSAFIFSKMLFPGIFNFAVGILAQKYIYDEFQTRDIELLQTLFIQKIGHLRIIKIYGPKFNFPDLELY